MSWVFNHDERDERKAKTHADMLCEINNLVSDTQRIIACGLKFDWQWLTHAGIEVNKPHHFCNIVAEYLIVGQDTQVGLSLAEMSKRYGLTHKIDAVKQYWDADYETSEIPLNSVLLPYGDQDCINAYALFQRQVPLLQRYNLTKLANICFREIRVLANMERVGLKINRDDLVVLAEEYTVKKEEVDSKLFELFGEKFNLDSGQQLSAYLYGGVVKGGGVEQVARTLKGGKVKTYTRKAVVERRVNGIGFKPPKGAQTATEGVFKTNKDILPFLVAKTKTQKEVVTLLLERSQIEKSLSSYFVGPQSHIQADGCIHSNMNQTVTATGRLSSSNVNVQNYPRGGTSPAKRPVISRWPV
jgi:DNA polymerase I-like protein with 3'-5' exonuclease and polymerase domains